MEPVWTQDILDFWFKELTPDDWFTGGAQLDERIRAHCLPLYEKLAAHVPPEAMTDPRAALAAIIALDQFPRNMFRGTARAFATDHLALELSRNALKNGFDRDMNDAERSFLAMPLMHSEALSDQEHCVKVFAEIGDEESLKYALEHRDIVEKYGRFPHRNRALGRNSSEDEQAFLESHKGYGQ
ncbi:MULTISPECIES: DUF924 family protein [Mesorhizobium]|uniref:DUF924 domain-containing protein n=1 Tax=Mesorhizobium denitrificans TaxID=2294114 RepID=A0A371XD35_9HYPH|nr:MULTISPECIES: DUF924 family protein [Mesorhizobium]RFC67147.1 DUF924 domain-containing protein [Mesorhizobium denitrificans]